MTESFDAVLAEMREAQQAYAGHHSSGTFRRLADRLAAAHAAEVGELEYRLQTANAYGLQCDDDIRALLARAEAAEQGRG